MAGGIYSVTFRLADSLPREVLDRWNREREGIIRRAAAMNRGLSDDETARLDVLHSERVERYLDAGAGDCWLRDPCIARIVEAAMRHFDGARYDLLAWCVMPNHVHAVVKPFEGAFALIGHAIMEGVLRP